MSGHTKGPWLTVDEASGNVEYSVYKCFVAMPTIRGITGEQRTAQYFENARLAASAPDMLEALEMFVHAEAVASTNPSRSFGVYVDAMEAARAAIKKARGEP